MRIQKNDDVVLTFFAGGFAQNFTKNLTTYNILYKSNRIQVLKNYNAIIAVYVNSYYNKQHKLFINKKFVHFSKTTQSHINKLIKYATLDNKIITTKDFSSILEKNVNI